jgi:surface protein
MFGGCTQFNNGLASGVTGTLFVDGKAPTRALTSTLAMFADCTSFNNSIRNWDVSEVTDMSLMFNGFQDTMIFNNGLASGVTGTLFVNGKAPKSALTRTFGMFNRCTSFNQSVSNWDASNVTNMSQMFAVCSAFDQPLDTWTLSGDLNANGMVNLFAASGLSQENLNKTLIHWATQYTNSSPSNPFPTGVQLNDSPWPPSGLGITNGYDKLTALPTDSPPGPGWTIDPPPL